MNLEVKQIKYKTIVPTFIPSIKQQSSYFKHGHVFKYWTLSFPSCPISVLLPNSCQLLFPVIKSINLMISNAARNFTSKLCCLNDFEIFLWILQISLSEVWNMDLFLKNSNNIVLSSSSFPRAINRNYIRTNMKHLIIHG